MPDTTPARRPVVTGRRAAAAALAAVITMPAEGLRQWAYQCPASIWTVCYGHTSTVDRTRMYSEPECRALLEQDMLSAVQTVERCAPGLPPHMLAAWADAVYNIGPSIVCDPRKSTAARLLAAHQWDAACDQLPRWNRATVAGVSVQLPGLTKRRQADWRLCRTGEV